MRIRLFWKILFSFWLTFICIVEGVWLIFYLYEIPRHRPREYNFVKSVAEVRLGAAETALRQGGTKGLQALLATWPEKERARMSLIPPGATPSQALGNKDRDPDEPMVFTREIVLPDGSSRTLALDATKLLPWNKHRGPLDLPPELIILGILGGLLFSSLLAWYLTAPVWRLRMGFEHLTQGKLGVRIKALMGSRRDEIADLARDFDIMAERMQSLVESREQLLYDVSHELRSPLARQHMAIGLARQNPQRIPALLDRIEQESSRMDELVGELLMLSRAESGVQSFDEYFDLLGLVSVVVSNTRFESETDGIRIDLHIHPPDPMEEMYTVHGDAELIRRALENVIRNGLRHSPRNSILDVRISAHPGDNSCTIEVADQGPGVPESSLTEIFEPFVHLKNNKKHGAGLGLAIAKRAITVHGGTIRAANQQHGGLRITIVLPLEPPDPMDQTEDA